MLFGSMLKSAELTKIEVGEVGHAGNEGKCEFVCTLASKADELASTYESPDDVINWYYGNKEQLSVIESQVVEDEIFDFILAEAKVTEKKMGYQDAIKPEDQTTES